jgi:predicted nucleic-acid-binding protein
MRAVDTNVLVRIVTRDDPAQLETADRFIGAGAWVSLLALAEATRALRAAYGLSARDIAVAVEMLLQHKDLTIQDEDTVAAAAARFRARPALGFTDCLLLEIARRAGHLPLGTFDRTLGKVDGAQRL